MTHLVNNAITHGIETAEARSAQQVAYGRITIRLQGNQTVISADDGAGIDPETVKAKAIQGPDHAGDGQTISCVDVYNTV